MKNPNKVAGMALIALLAMSCSKSDSKTSPPSNTGGTITPPSSESHGINATERKLLGKWMITKERDTSFYINPDGSIDETRPAPPRDNNDPAFYYEFKANDVLTTLPDAEYGHLGIEARRSTTDVESNWIFDDNKQRLYILYSNQFYKIVSLTDTELHLVMDETTPYNSGSTRSVLHEYYKKM